MMKTVLKVVRTKPSLPKAWKESKKLPDAPSMKVVEQLVSGAQS